MLNAYDVEVKKADAARVLILHKLGGVYLDLGKAPRCPEPQAGTIEYT